MTPRVPGPDWAAGWLAAAAAAGAPTSGWSGLTGRMGVSSVGDVEEEEVRESSAALLKTRTEGGGVERPGRANGCFPSKPRPSAATPPTQAQRLTYREQVYGGAAVPMTRSRGCYATY